VNDGLAHLVGDYVVQSDWMASQKTSRHLPAAIHAATYTACFVPITRKWKPLAVIGLTHFVIDRWRLARHLIWLKNQQAPAEWRHEWDDHVKATGYHVPIEGRQQVLHDPSCVQQGKPIWMAVWLMIITDNTMHIAINKWALRRWVK